MLERCLFGDLSMGDRFYFIRDLSKDNLCVKVGTYAGLDSAGQKIFVYPHQVIYTSTFKEKRKL